MTINRIFLHLSAVIIALMAFATTAFADETKSRLQQQAEEAAAQKNVPRARSLYLSAYGDYAAKGHMRQGVECSVKAAALYYGENSYQEAFDLLRSTDQTIEANVSGDDVRASLHYLTTKERLQMYIRMKRLTSAQEQLARLANFAEASKSENIQNDLLYNKAIFHYTFGQTAQGNAVFREMAARLTEQKEYDKVDEVYQTLIESSRRSGSANMVAQSYSNYMAWKDSASAKRLADETGALRQQIAANEADIADRDASLTTRKVIIGALATLAAILAAALAVGAVILLRYIVKTRRQQKLIKLANESNELKSKFISNISSQMAPALSRLDAKKPEVQALNAFTQHIQQLSELDAIEAGSLEMENTQIEQFCEEMMDTIRGKVKNGVLLTIDAAKMSTKIHRPYVAHIVQHLLANAAHYTPEDGTIKLVFKKRGPHTNQVMVSDTGCGIPEERQEDVFKPFLEIHDLTTGDGLGLPICKQMAIKMNGDLTIDKGYTKGTRFILELHN